MLIISNAYTTAMEMLIYYKSKYNREHSITIIDSTLICFKQENKTIYHGWHSNLKILFAIGLQTFCFQLKLLGTRCFDFLGDAFFLLLETSIQIHDQTWRFQILTSDDPKVKKIFMLHTKHSYQLAKFNFSSSITIYFYSYNIYLSRLHRMVWDKIFTAI